MELYFMWTPGNQQEFALQHGCIFVPWKWEESRRLVLPEENEGDHF